MATFEDYRGEYQRFWTNLVVRPESRPAAHKTAQRLAAGKTRYEEVEGRTGVPWWFVGLCHYRESDFNFDTYLGNGQPLGRRTTIVPKNRGPFTGLDAFLQGAIDALRIEGFLGARDWSIARVLFRLEGFNGYGYHGKGVASPYLWGGSTAYGPPESRGGKYIRDHVFDPGVVDRQLGTAVVLKLLQEIDATIVFAAPAAAADQQREPDEELAADVLWLQQALNRLGTTPSLAEDGKNGPRTMAAVSAFQQRNGLEDTGLADARTVAAVQRALQTSAVTVVDPAIAARLDELERRQRLLRTSTDVQSAAEQGSRPPPAPQPPADIYTALLQLIARGGQLPSADGLQPGAVRQLLETLGRMPSSVPGPASLGQVNGALGDTLGQLLDGKKTAIGIIGAAATEILSRVPSTTGLGQVLDLVTPAIGLGPFTMPAFLAMAAWGVLGKFEKWNQQSAQSTRVVQSHE